MQEIAVHEYQEVYMEKLLITKTQSGTSFAFEEIEFLDEIEVQSNESDIGRNTPADRDLTLHLCELEQQDDYFYESGRHNDKHVQAE